MTLPSAAAPPESDAVLTTRRAESDAVYLALGTGVAGGVYGFLVATISPSLALAGEHPFALLAALGTAIVTAAASGLAYWRARAREGQQWRRDLPRWQYAVNTLSVVIVHTVLGFLSCYALYRVLALGFIGLSVIVFWSVVLMAVTLGLAVYISYLSAARMSTQRMSALLLAFIAIGVLTSMVTSPDPQWWLVHFSRLGTFDAPSSQIFNGTLIAAGLLVTTFAVYVAHDMTDLVGRGVLANPRAPGFVSTMFVIMGVMLAGVGIFTFDANFILHNVSASGMAAMYLVLLITGPRMLRGMPRSYFVSSWAYLAATLTSVVLFAVGYFSLTAFEIIVFAVVFGWIAVFIRFLGVAGAPR
ncbi:hypothetical protein [Microbacterium sp. zg-YB36]|uniref:hypothetical protein n=1 Tax=Microbacterium sp. zg-YB36 TaxID=2969407 RepID=UPI00214C42F4|nr:hypothetical protein [Microbacterium sp. zg-YB36]MDL5352734.1 hypothetical protein [Microbacterium sp. zg-YB36]